MNVCHRWWIVFFVYFGCKLRQVLVSVRWSRFFQDGTNWAGLGLCIPSESNGWLLCGENLPHEESTQHLAEVKGNNGWLVCGENLPHKESTQHLAEVIGNNG